MSQSKLMSFFSSATEKQKRDSDDSDESQPGPSTPKKTSSDIYNDTTSISCKRSVCDPLKLKMTPKVNYRGVTVTPKKFFEGKTLGLLVIKAELRRLIHVFEYYCLDKQCILFLVFQPSCEHAKTRPCRLISVFCFVFLQGNKTKGSDAKSITHCEIFASKFKRH